MSSSAPRRVSRRIAAITPSATLAVDAQAKALKAAGENVIGFGAGEPDFATPDHIVEAAVEGSPRWGADRVTSANLPENSPNTRWWLRSWTTPKDSASQKAVVPPLPRRTS